MKARLITVFGSGRVQEADTPYQQAQTLGQLLAKAGLGVCTGGYRGVMESAVRGAHEAAGETVGVVIRGSKGTPNRWIKKLYEENSWQERLEKLIQLGDGYVIMDGGVGTLNEFFMVWEMANKGLHQKPIVLLGQTPSALARILEKNALVECPDRPQHAASPAEALKIFHEAFGV